MNDVPVAVASRSFSRNPVLRRELLAEFPNTTFNDSGISLKGEALTAFLAGHERAITALERLDDAILDTLPALRVVSKYGVGLDMIDLAAMSRRGIQLGWTAGVNRRSVSELVIAFAIALLRHVPASASEVRAGIWRQIEGRQLTGKTFGIVGCGHVGKDVVRLLHPYDCTVLVHDIRHFPDFYAEHGVEPVSLDSLLERSDVVSLHLPLDSSTEKIISAERLALMPAHAVLLNIARGGLVDEAALRSNLAAGKLAAAGFDVFVDEPPSDQELLSLPNFLATPHIGGSTREAILAMGRAAIRGLNEFGDPLVVAGG